MMLEGDTAYIIIAGELEEVTEIRCGECFKADKHELS